MFILNPITDEFANFLTTASEKTKRQMSDWQYHYPTEIEIWVEENLENANSTYIKTVCGCNSSFQYEFGVGKHGRMQ